MLVFLEILAARPKVPFYYVLLFEYLGMLRLKCETNMELITLYLVFSVIARHLHYTTLLMGSRPLV